MRNQFRSRHGVAIIVAAQRAGIPRAQAEESEIDLLVAVISQTNPAFLATQLEIAKKQREDFFKRSGIAYDDDRSPWSP